MAGTFSRLHRFIRETVRFTVLNNEFDNIINNMDVNGLGLTDLSTSVAQFGTAADPLTSLNVVGTLPTSLLGEIQRIRSVLSRLKGGSVWYADVGRTLNLNPNDLVVYAPFSGRVVSPINVDTVLLDTIQRGAYINATRLTIANTVATVTATIPVSFTSEAETSGSVKFGSYAMKSGTNIDLCLPAHQVGSSGKVSLHTKGHAAGACLAYNPLLGVALYRNSSNFIVAVVVKSTASGVSAKTTAAVTGTTAMTSAYQHVLLTYNFLKTSSDYMGLMLDGAAEGTALNAASLAINPGGGGLWFFGVIPQDQFISGVVGTAVINPWTKFSSMSVIPNDASDGWLLTGTGAQGTVSSGVLNIATVAGAGTLYSLATNIALNAQTVEVKVRVNSSDLGVGGALICDIQDASVNGGASGRLCVFLTGDGRLTAGSNLTLTDRNLNFGSVHLNISEFHLIRITSSGAAGALATKIYVDGALAMSFTNTDTTAVGADLIQWGVPAATVAFDDADVDFEYYAYHIAVFAPFVHNTSSGFMDDIALIRADGGSTSEDIVPSILSRQLRFNPAAIVYGSDPRPGAYRTPTREFAASASTAEGTVATTKFSVISDGIEPIDLAFQGKATSNQATDVLKLGRASGAAVHPSSFGRVIGNASNVDATILAQFKCVAGLNEFTLFHDATPAVAVNSVTGILSQRKAK